MEHARLRELPPAMARRVLRAAARSLGANLSFEHTEQILAAAALGTPAGARLDLPGGLKAERSLREIRLTRGVAQPVAGPAHVFMIPGEILSAEYGVHLLAEAATPATATLRPWKPGDRVTLRYSRGPKKVAEVLDRLKVSGRERKNWPVVESGGRIVWMRGAEVEAPAVKFTVRPVP
jgi:tRNA(Ile)-lysidine synthase